LENWLKLCCTLEHAPSSGTPRIRPTAVRRVAPGEEDLGEEDFAEEDLALSGPTIVSLLLTDRDRPERQLQVSNRLIQGSGFRHIGGE